MTSVRILMLLPLTALMLLAPAHARAQEINEEGAQAVKAMFQTMLDSQKSLNNMEGSGAISYEGDLTVEPVGTYYAVTFPHMKINYPGGEMLDIGMVSANVSPHTAPGQWAMTVAIPTPLVFLNASGTQDFKVTIGSQNTAGIWDEKSQNFMKMDASYKDINMESSAEQELDFSIPEIAVRYDFSPDAKGLWSGPGYVVVKNMAMDMPESAGSFRFQELRLDVAMDQYDPATAIAIREQTAKLNEAALKLQESEEEPDPTKTAEIEAMSAAIMQSILKSANGFDASYAFTGFKMDRAAVADQPASTVDIAQGKFGFKLADLLSPNISFGLQFGYDGFDMKPLPAGMPPEFVPRDLNLDFLISQIPLQKLIETGMSAPVAMDPNNPVGQAAMMGIALQLPVILAQAGTQITQKDNYFGNTLFRIDMSGDYKVDAASPLMAVGTGRVVMNGLDEVLAKINEMSAAKPNDPATLQLQQTAMGLSMVKAFAKPEAGADGKIAYILNIELTPEGKSLVNGQDMMTIMGAGQNPAMPAPTSPTEPAQEEAPTTP